ncbi:uncharacterized protein BcabD6B2_34170 [Babesia caballi]|uniref:riboflavin kinase n=1 Tax=Babesia caballi TaxID=5871 RepID=A0AAV4LUR1_BABCB|nr:hypothetical protein BcabD6B2_34170 [Babesia caballi]
MTRNQCAAASKEIVVVVDAELCIVDTNTVLVNCLGTVANIQRRYIRSPWKVDDFDEKPRDGCGTEEVYGNQLREEEFEGDGKLNGDTPSAYHTLSGLAGEHALNGGDVTQLCHLSNDPIKAADELSNGFASKKTADVASSSCLACSKVKRGVYESRLRYSTQLVRDGKGHSRETIREALAAADVLLRHAGHCGSPRFASLSHCFSNSSVTFVFSDGRSKLHELQEQRLNNPLPVQQFVENIAVASYQREADHEWVNHPEECVKKLCSALLPDCNDYSATVVLVSNLPTAIERILKVSGAYSKNPTDIKIEVVHPEDVNAFTKACSQTKYILYPSESVILNRVINVLLPVQQSNVLWAQRNILTSSGKAEESQGDSGTTKVDLLCEPNLANFDALASAYLKFVQPVQLKGTVVKGFGRGAASLGIPTANLSCEYIPHLVPGVYFGTCWLTGNTEVEADVPLKTILSVGFNPHFDHATYSVEPYLYRTFKSSFVGQEIQLSIEGFLRTEAKFDSLQGLIAAIQRDVVEHKLITLGHNGGH